MTDIKAVAPNCLTGVKVLDLTSTGSRLRRQLLRRMTARPLPLSRLTADEQRALLRILERLVD